MKTLLLVMDEQRVILDRLYEAIEENSAHCDILRLDKAQQFSLAVTLRDANYRSYDRVVIFSRLKRLLPQAHVLRSVPGLVFLEHDACQNFMSTSKYKGVYSRFYKLFPWCRVLSSGSTVARKLREQGIDAVFVSKGYDQALMKNLHRKRDIDVAFIGSIKGGAYAPRAELLETVAAATNLVITRTSSGQDYVDMLNRVRIFLSADVDMGEYMIKNFEAMACGCVLLARSQGEEEDAAIGFIDGKNAVLYRTAEEAIKKIAWLGNNPDVAVSIADEGQRFAEERYSFSRVGRDLALAIEAPMRCRPRMTTLQRLWLRLRYRLVP